MNMKMFTLEQRVWEGEREDVRRIPVENGKWVVPHVGTSHSSEVHWEDDDDDHVTTFDEHIVDDYVIAGPSPERVVLGRTSQRTNWHGGRSSRSSASIALIGDQPFGVILHAETNGERGFCLHFVCSRQVHKGELGRRPSIPRPQFAREAPVSDATVSTRTERPIHRRDQLRGRVGWARLTETAALIGMAPEEFVRRYIRFAHAEYSVLDVLFEERREALHMRPARRPERFSTHRLEPMFARDMRTAWIRKGFACAALYLHHFGYTPEPHVERRQPAAQHVAASL